MFKPQPLLLSHTLSLQLRARGKKKRATKVFQAPRTTKFPQALITQKTYHLVYTNMRQEKKTILHNSIRTSQKHGVSATRKKLQNVRMTSQFFDHKHKTRSPPKCRRCLPARGPLSLRAPTPSSPTGHQCARRRRGATSCPRGSLPETIILNPTAAHVVLGGNCYRARC